MGLTDINRFLPNDQYDAAMNAASPSAANPFATVADITANNEWSEILANGNTSGANNVIINQPQSLIFEGGAFGSNENLFITRGTGGLGAEDEFWVTGDKSVHLRIRNTSNDANAYLDRFGSWAAVDETGGESIALTPKGQRINFVSPSGAASNSNLDASGMTGNRLWTLPDASGTIALTSDYTLANVLSNGNTTGGNNIVLSNTDDILLDDNGAGSGPSRVQWNVNNYLEYDDQGDGVLLVQGNSGVSLRSGTNSLDFLGSNTLTVNTGVAAYPTVAFANNTINEGSLTSVSLTADRTWTLPDATGTIALLSDVQAADALDEVLANGNTTGANNIIVTSGQEITSSSGSAMLNLRPFSDNEYILGTGSTGLGTNSVSVYGLHGDGLQMLYSLSNTYNDAFGVGVYAQGATLTQHSAREIIVMDNALGAASSPNFDTKAVFIASRGSTINTGVTNTVMLGTVGATGKTDDTVYVNQIGFWEDLTNEGLLQKATLTGTRTWTLPDATGTVALTTDSLPTSSTLATVLGNGNTTGGSDIVVQSGDELLVNIGGFVGFSAGDVKIAGGTSVVAFVDQSSGEELEFNPDARTIVSDGLGITSTLSLAASTASRTWTLPDATGTVALTSDITGGFTLDDAANIAVNTTTGTQIATATTQKLGFYGATPVVQPTAITQTYSTASSTHAARTYTALTDSTGGTANTTVAAVSGSGADATINDNFADIIAQLANLAADQANTAQVTNQVIDILQSLGLKG